MTKQTKTRDACNNTEANRATTFSLRLSGRKICKKICLALAVLAEPNNDGDPNTFGRLWNGVG